MLYLTPMWYTGIMKDLTVFSASVIDKFETAENGCWIWKRGKNPGGYGVVGLSKHGKALAHRVMYTVFKGEIPRGLSLDHLCKTPACINPNHLEPVTHQENIIRGVGSKAHCINGHKYTPENTLHRQREGRGKERSCRTCRDLRNSLRYVNVVQ